MNNVQQRREVKQHGEVKQSGEVQQRGEIQQRVEKLSPLQQALLQKMVRQKQVGQSAIQPQVRNGKAPASFAQQRLWFLEQLGGNSGFYNIPLTLRFQGVLNPTVLQAALHTVVRRHEILRTHFSIDENQLLQWIEPDLLSTVQLLDWKSSTVEEQKCQLQHFLEAENRHPFDLARGPLWRASLLQFGEHEHVLHAVFHHIVIDGWSLNVLVSELTQLYDAFAQGKPSPLPEPVLQYADFAIWQKNWLQPNVIEKQIEYWRRQLASAPALLPLPIDHPRPPVQTFAGAHFHVQLDKQLSLQLKAHSQQTGTTLFMTLLAAYAILLARLSGEQDIVIGSPIANRTRQELEGMIGFFINTLVLRIRLTEELTFSQLLEQTRQTVLDAFTNQDTPFEQLVEILQPQRNLSHQPLFQVMFVLQNVPMPEGELAGLSITPLATENVTAKFDLTLTLSESEDGLAGVWEYSSALFEAATIERFATHFEVLLRAIVRNPEQAIHKLPLLSSPQQQQLVKDWNATDAEFPESYTFHQWFSKQAQATPDAPALYFNGETLSYLEVEQRANQLAHHLQSLGIGCQPQVESIVGLCVERSFEMIIGMLAILKAGAAYLPLDPSYPLERIVYMIEDAKPDLILTQSHLLANLPEAAPPTLCFDSLRLATPTTPPDSSVTPDHLAYIIYTSGSTGRPKGVLVPHRGLMNVLESQRHHFQPQPGDRVLQFSSFSFDAAASEITLSLGMGATLYLASRQTLLPGSSLHDFLEREAISMAILPPTALATLPVSALPALHTVCVAGEACSADLVQRWAKDRRFFNLYGPTEVTIWATLFSCQDQAQIPPIGKPILNTQLYVLDEHWQLVPAGVTGELYIGGVGVVRGYLGRPELSAERFIPDAFSGKSGARLYKTGDLVRYRNDGVLEFLGRNDAQVKLRGFRIEIGEIEAVLSLHPQVQDAVVLLHQEQNGHKQLVAYVVADTAQVADSAQIDGNELRLWMKEKLPDYMVPALYIFLDQLPLTPNGKVARTALPAPSSERPQLRQHYQAPETPLHKVIAEIWQKVLGLEQVGIHDHFFELGGDSIKGAILVNNIQQRLGEVVQVVAIFDAPTVAQMSSYLQNLFPKSIERIATEHANTIDSLATTIASESRERIRAGGENSNHFPLSFSQQRLWFLAQLTGSSNTYNVPLVLQIEGALDVAALEASIGEVVKRHDVLRTSFPMVAGNPVQEIAPDRGWQLTVVTAPTTTASEDSQNEDTQNAEQWVKQWIAAEVQYEFDLSQGPMLRTTLLALAADRHILLLVTHHTLFDGWSMAVLIHELTTFYEAKRSGNPSSLQELSQPELILPELPLQYADYALWQRNHWQPNHQQAELAYWHRQLADAPALLTLPLDHPRPAMQNFTGGHLPFVIEPKLCHKLKAVSQQAGTTLFMTLLAAYATLLSRLSGQTDVVIGSPIANRSHQELEAMIGFFVNTLALRVRLDEDPSFVELLQQVRRTTLDAFQYQQVPFEQLVEVLQPVRNLSHQPLFQVMFVLQNTPIQASEVAGLNLVPVVMENITAKFDLTLTLTESEAGLVGVWEYSSDLFERSSIERFSNYFRTLLAGLVNQPEQSVNQAPLFQPEEAAQLLGEWSSPVVVQRPETTLSHLFEAQVVRNPKAIALEMGDQRLCYGELASRVAALAAHLKQHGVGTESLVAVCMERSVEQVVSVLAVIKAGGTYVPIDPSYPSERLNYLFADAQPVLVLTQQRFVERLPAESTQRLILDSQDDSLPHSAHTLHGAPNQPVLPEALAYLIYTSGSTGQPKGVGVSQRNICNLIAAQIESYELGTGARVYLSLSLSFDAASSHLWMALCSGATLCLAPNDGLLAGEELHRVLKQLRITHAPFSTSLLALLPAGDLPDLRLFITGGEACSAELAARWAGRYGFYNEYGPTEATVCSTVSRCLPDGRTPSIGKAIANAEVYVLDTHLNPVPVGVTGELYIGGAGVARGYHRQPQLTAERFVPHPFSQQPGARLYKTGDLVRFRADGHLEFLGRSDQQVKLRGFRIELGEIEATLLKHNAVQDAVVLLRNDSAHSPRLVAYVKSASTELSAQSSTESSAEALTSESLRLWMKQKLPSQMIPAQLVILEAFPLTVNGKVDRQALAKQTIESRLETAASVPPRDACEARLVQIWEEILHVSPIGVQDNFFEKGGHSLLVVQLMARIEQEFGQSLPLATLFRAATIEEIAQLLRQPALIPTDSPLVALRASGEQLPFFLVHPVGGNVFCYRDLVQQLDPDLPVYALQSTTPGNAANDFVPNKFVTNDFVPNDFVTVEEMAACYIEAIQQVQPTGPYRLGGWSLGGMIAYEMAQQLRAQGQEVGLVALIDPAIPGKHNNQIDDAMMLAYLVGEMGDVSNQELRHLVDRLGKLNEEEQLQALVTWAAETNSLPAGIGAEQVRPLLRRLKRNVQAMSHYRPTAFPGWVMLFFAAERPAKAINELLQSWTRLANNGLNTYKIAGDHFSSLRMPHVQVLAKELSNYLQPIAEAEMIEDET